jgi:hypothetical protein
VAFTIGVIYGFATVARSFPYVAVWSKDKKVLVANTGCYTLKVSEKIFDGSEQTYQETSGSSLTNGNSTCSNQGWLSLGRLACGWFIREFLLGMAPKAQGKLNPKRGAPQVILTSSSKEALALVCSGRAETNLIATW